MHQLKLTIRLNVMNDTILKELNTPVSTTEFVDRFTKKFQQWGKVTPALQETWRTNCLALNNTQHSKDDVIKYIVSAPTGSGKTENVITYCTMLPKEYTVLLSTNLTTEADNLANKINTESPSEDNRACAYHSKTDITIKEASQYQVVVVTHEFYKRHYTGDKEWLLLGENRDLIIIDEALDTMKEIFVEEQQILRAITIFEYLAKTSNPYGTRFITELASLKNDLARLKEMVNRSGGGTNLMNSNKYWSLKDDVQVLSIELRKYQLFLNIIESKEINYNKILTDTEDASEDKKIKMRLLQTLTVLNQLTNRQTYITANKGIYSMNRVVDTTPDKSLVCFDATADVNKIYEMRAKYHGDLVKVAKVDKVRSYSSVDMHVCKMKTGKSKITIERVTSIMQNVQFGDKTLIVTQLQNESFFNEIAKSNYPDKVIDVAHWNALTGLNKWQEFDTCIIAGLNHKPKSFSQNRIIVNTNEVTAFGDEQHTLNADITDSTIVAEIVQAINRIRIRTVTKPDGGCESANIYITLPTSNIEVYKELITTQMSSINVKDWDLPSPTTAADSVGHFNSIIQYLKSNMKTGDKMLLVQPRKALGINAESYRSIIGKTASSKEQFKKKLEVFGLELLEITEVDSRGRSKAKPTIYIHKLR